MFKNAPVQIKAAGSDDGLAEGQFRALVSVFNNVDSTGDMVMPGAFAKTLSEWSESGDPIPVYWSHRMDDPEFLIGQVLQASETDAGLEVLGQLDVEDGSPKARAAYRALKGRRTTQFSFAYDVIDGGPVEKDGQEYQELRELKLSEVSTTPIGANDQTALLAVKRWAESTPQVSALNAINPADYAQLSLGLKSGRTLSAKNESTLRDAVDALASAVTHIKSVLASLDSGQEPSGGKANASEASDTGPAKDEEPTRAKSEEPTRRTSVDTWTAQLNLTALEVQT
jgi:HK97 family phage prohead protease